MSENIDYRPDVKDKYVEKPWMCPRCGSFRIEWTPPMPVGEIGDGVISIDASCERCGERWTEEYKIASISRIGNDNGLGLQEIYLPSSIKGNQDV